MTGDEARILRALQDFNILAAAGQNFSSTDASPGRKESKSPAQAALPHTDNSTLNLTEGPLGPRQCSAKLAGVPSEANEALVRFVHMFQPDKCTNCFGSCGHEPNERKPPRLGPHQGQSRNCLYANGSRRKVDGNPVGDAAEVLQLGKERPMRLRSPQRCLRK